MRFSFKKLLLFAGLALLLFLGWFAWQLFGPSPPIVVSKATTYISAPLRADGLPDYEKYVLEKYREGVTPENNAAVLFWQAMGPGDMASDDFANVAKEIGLQKIPPPEKFLQDVYGDETRKRVATWLENSNIIPREDDAEGVLRFMEELEMSRDDFIHNFIDQANERPWTSAQIPPLAEWVAANENPLALLTSATERPMFRSPPPELLNDTSESLVLMSLESIQQTREAARALCARAMWHLGEGRHDKAWGDMIAMYRLSRLTGQDTTLVEQLVSIAIEGIANRATLTLLDAPDITPDLARQIRQDLHTLDARKSIGVSLDHWERILALSAVMEMRNGNSAALGGGNGFDKVAMSAAFDWSIPLRNMNQWYDELSSAAKLPTWSARIEAMEKFEERLKHVAGSASPRRALGSFFSRKIRSELMSDILVALVLPALSAACTAEDRANTQLALTQLAAALAIYSAEHGEHPEALEALVPEVLEKLPVDLYHNNPFIYRRTKNGYLLYSRGPNGQDDAGSNQLMQNFKGHSTDLQTTAQLHELLGDDLPMVEDETAVPSDDSVMRPLSEDDSLLEHIPQDADDIAIRLPLPKLELPKAK